ncbi:hypothetical protein I4U23_019823 [Adineta vaga]|nr:hypothetical protein I4U23_019823 [Adineta vaga]
MSDVVNGSTLQCSYSLLHHIKEQNIKNAPILLFKSELTDHLKIQHNFDELESMALARKQSFKNWPHIKPNADDMSSNGWFSCKINDRVICIYCDNICQQWTPYDDPEEVHRRLSPRCPFIQSKSSSSSNDTLKIVTQNSNAVFQPHHSNMREISRRVESFKKPSWTLTSPSPDDLAYAGFFYSGADNVVTCFYCNGSLHQWGIKDSPKIEHARWFSHCLYAKHLCGDKLYGQIQVAKKQHELKKKTLDQETLNRFVNARLDLPIVQRLLKQYRLAIIKRCLEDQLKLNHDDFASDEEFSMSCFLLQKQLDIIKGDEQKIIVPSKNRMSVSSNEITDGKLQECVVCLTEERQIACLPCGHLCTCTCCGYSVRTCPMCRTHIESFVRVYS